MTAHNQPDTIAVPLNQAIWAILSMTGCVMLLISAEFLPISLLTPMAEGLDVTEGQTGQAISISGLFAVLTSLLITRVARNIDRKKILLWMTALLCGSLVITATAPNFTVLMIGRALLGITVGGFWSLAVATLMRLVPPEDVPRALTIMFTGQSASTAFAAPIGSYLGDVIGWRGVFWLLVPLAVITLFCQWRALPALPPRQHQNRATLWEVASRPYFARGMIAAGLVWAAAFTMFTYLRPFLEQVLSVGVNGLSSLFLIIGVAGFAGTWGAGRLVGNHLRRLLNVTPAVMGCITAGLLLLGNNLFAVAALLMLWGVMKNAMSIIWMSWMSQNAKDSPEAAGSLMVAIIQASILSGAAIGGFLLDNFSIQTAFSGSIVIGVIAVLLIGNGQKLLNPHNL